MDDSVIIVGFTFSLILNIVCLLVIATFNLTVDQNVIIKGIDKIDNSCLYSLEGSMVEIKANCNKYKIGDKIFKGE